MGSFASGFVFTGEPRFAEIAAGFPGCSARGYRHGVSPIWLLDLFEEPWRGSHAPFTARATEIKGAPPAPAAETVRFLDELDALLAALPEEDQGGGGARECRLALSVGERAGTRTFFFAGDDELVDLACVVAGGAIERFRCRMPHLTVRRERGRTEVIPNVLVEDDELDPAPELLQAIGGAVTWPIGTPHEVVEPQLHESAYLLWPAEVDNPADLLGIGTWDFGAPLERNFRVVFEARAAAR